MWKKPSEFSEGKFKAQGFEVSVGPTSPNMKDFPDATPSDALSGWKKSPSHYDVILNRGDWTSKTWTRIGGAIYGPFAHVLFAQEEPES